MPSHNREAKSNLDEEQHMRFLADNAKDAPLPSFRSEVSDIVKLALPLFISGVAWVALKTTDTALVGHVGTRELAAVALADLYTSSSGCLISGRVLGVFASQAVGAGQHKTAGKWLQVSLAVLSLIAIPVAALWAVTGPFLRLVRADNSLIGLAWYYALVLMTCFPARIASSQLNQFFQSQRIMKPSVVSTAFAATLNLLGGLPLVLGIPIPGFSGFGFVAAPIVTVCVEYLTLLMVVSVFCWRLGLHQKCWPGWSWAYVTRERMSKYFAMYLPAALSIASDFWRVAVIGAIAARLGRVELAVFTSSYRIMWTCLIFSSSVAAACGIKIGQALGKGEHHIAKRLPLAGLSVAFVFLFGLSALVMLIPGSFATIFSSDSDVIDQFKSVAVPLASTILSQNLSVALERIVVSVGKAREIFVVGLIGSWGGQVPGVLLCTIFWRNDLVGLYVGVTAGYAITVVIYAVLIAKFDWQELAIAAAERAEVDKGKKDAGDDQDRDVEYQELGDGDEGKIN